MLLCLQFFCNALLFGFYFFSKSLIQNYLYDYLESSQQEIGKSIELIVNQINMSSLRFLQNSDIYSLLDNDTLTYNKKNDRLKNILDDMSLNPQIMKALAIVTVQGDVYQYSSENIQVEKPDEAFISQLKKSNLSAMWEPVKRDMNNNAYILFAKKFHNFFTGQNLGYLIIYIPENTLFDVYKRITSEYGYSFLLTDNDCIISHPDKDKIGKIIIDSDIFSTDKDFVSKSVKFNSQDSIIAISMLNNHLQHLNVDWKIISVVSKGKLYAIIVSFNKYIWIIEVLVSVITILFSIRISTKIADPISVLTSKVKRFGTHNHIRLDFVKGTHDEIRELEKCYNDMIIRISELIDKNNEEKEKQRELELIALQAQINPHFLYNTLDAIACIAKLKNQTEIDKLVMALARFFRISLHKGDKFITVQEEIDHVKSFVTIEQIRFPEQFDVIYNIQEDILDCSILKILLQPIVENAIKHGISVKGDFGHIWISGFREGNDLKLEVIDDGVGFDTNFSLENCAASHMGGYGLRNVDERIKLEYGQEYGIKIKSSKDAGTKVEIRLKI